MTVHWRFENNYYKLYINHCSERKHLNLGNLNILRILWFNICKWSKAKEL